MVLDITIQGLPTDNTVWKVFPTPFIKGHILGAGKTIKYVS